MQSMTGYGRCRISEEGRDMTIEVKCVNHRFLDLSFHLPRELSFLEEPFRQILNTGTLRRGHVEVNVSYVNNRSDAIEAHIDTTLLEAFNKAVHDVDALLIGYPSLTVADVLNLSGAYTMTKTEEDTAAVTAMAERALQEALLHLDEMRDREGSHLKSDLFGYLSALNGCRDAIAELAPKVPLDYRSRLLNRIKELEPSGIDEQRVAQEVAIMADHCAIDEELSRLESHIIQFRLMAENEAEVGRKLDFLIQEMNREVNTIGSKANCLEITEQVIAAKSLIEKMREQVQNVL